MAALLGKQRGLEVHVLDKVEQGLKPDLVRQLGASYHTGPVKDVGFVPDIIIECTGVSALIAQAMEHLGNDGILCLTGVSSKDQNETLDLGTINRTMVLENSVIFGSVNANLHHYELAEQALLKADKSWLSRLLSRHVPIANYKDAFTRHPDDIKVVIDFSAD